MSVTTQVSGDGATVTIYIQGRFDFGIHQAFRAAYEQAAVNVAHPAFIVDLSATEYMDSSALGMLLLLREHAGSDRNRVAITHCSAVIREILDIANFDKLFTVISQHAA
ncbi:MAG: antisigma-factor antagonist STAS domain-containing protein [Halothiobacillaceae bacterium]|nr:MAG: antisigma-factor antagonist STAS domain-containing protein [Halothiobacillaceae bacterium]